MMLVFWDCIVCSFVFIYNRIVLFSNSAKSCHFTLGVTLDKNSWFELYLITY